MDLIGVTVYFMVLGGIFAGIRDALKLWNKGLRRVAR